MTALVSEQFDPLANQYLWIPTADALDPDEAIVVHVMDHQPDLVALAQTINYLDAMTERVLEYDETGKFPTYLIVIDQHFFEVVDGGER